MTIYGRILAAAGAAIVLCGPVGASKLSQLGNATTYPVRKDAKDVQHDTSHPVKSATSPVNQAGQTTSRTFHKIMK